MRQVYASAMQGGEEAFVPSVRPLQRLCQLIYPAICRAGCQRGTCVDTPGACFCEQGFSGAVCNNCWVSSAPSSPNLFQQSARLVVVAHAWFRTHATVHPDSSGRLVKFVGILTDYHSFTFPAVYCEMKFSGSDWALVRHAPEGQIWHNAKSFIAPFSLF